MTRFILLVSSVAVGSIASLAPAQLVPGFAVELFAAPGFPNLLSFRGDGVLFAGRDDNVAGSATPRFISKITADGVDGPYGNVPIPDPDAVVADTFGGISGVANSVLVGGLTMDNGPGRVSAIHPDGSVAILWEGSTYGNISEMKIDATNRLLFTSFNTNKVFVSVGGATPTVLFNSGTGPVYLTVATDGRIFTGGQTGTIRINAADGALINANFAQFTGRTSIEFGAGGGFGTDLLALDTNAGLLFTVSRAGVKTQIGSGFVDCEDLAIGPCGAVYVSRRMNSEILRISQQPSADIDTNGAVNASDLAILLGAWSSSDCASDLNQDGIVNAADLAMLLGAWG